MPTRFRYHGVLMMIYKSPDHAVRLSEAAHPAELRSSEQEAISHPSHPWPFIICMCHEEHITCRLWMAMGNFLILLNRKTRPSGSSPGRIVRAASALMGL